MSGNARLQLPVSGHGFLFQVVFAEIPRHHTYGNYETVLMMACGNEK